MSTHETRTPVAIARFDDPHLGDYARHPERTEGVIALILIVGIGGVCAFGAAYWVNAPSWVLAVTMGVGLFALGFGMTAWGKYLMPQGPFVEDRHVLAGNRDEREAMAAALVERSGIVVKRRRMLGGLLSSGLGIFSIVAIFPLLRSLGPVPKKELDTTNWGPTVRLVDATGTPIHRNQLLPGSIVTVYPEGLEQTDTSQAYNQVVLIRLTAGTTTNPTKETVVTPTSKFKTGPSGYIAYSKVCTHLGCPVGLYEQELKLLVCPCHQSMFRVDNAAIPQFGPAPRPLPELPLSLDKTGFLQASAGFDQAVGPGFWERSNVPVRPLT